MNNYKYPQFPLYIPSKGRYNYMMTSKALTEMGVKHFIVVEPFEVDLYNKAIREMGLLTKVIELDLSYKEKYELCDSKGLSRSTGPGPARNFIWDHSIANKYDFHWVMDDNIKSFVKFHNNLRVKVCSGGYWRAMEDFVLRYTNVAMAGPAYTLFVPPRAKINPFCINTRIYSCNLIRNDIPFRWRGRYNEDTIISIDILKAKWCTIQFYAFLQEKLPTQIIKGGNTDEFYFKEGELKKGGRYADGGTVAKSILLKNVHPDVTKVLWKFGRCHHSVNYKIFKGTKLLKKKNFIPPIDIDYGLVLVKNPRF